MADVITVTVPDLPAIAQADGSELIAVWSGNRLSRISQRSLRGTKTFSGPFDPPSAPADILALNPILGDRWRNTSTGDEWKATWLQPFTWTFDGNLKGAPGVSDQPGPPGKQGSPGQPGVAGPPGTTTVNGLTDATAAGKMVAKATAQVLSDQSGAAQTTDTYIGISSLTQTRTVVLPPAFAFPRGPALFVVDESGACSGDIAIIVVASGSDTIAGQASVTMGSPFQKLTFHSNGSNLWTVA